jgi:hypothetical protein
MLNEFFKRYLYQKTFDVFQLKNISKPKLMFVYNNEEIILNNYNYFWYDVNLFHSQKKNEIKKFYQISFLFYYDWYPHVGYWKIQSADYNCLSQYMRDEQINLMKLKKLENDFKKHLWINLGNNAKWDALKILSKDRILKWQELKEKIKKM